MKSPNLKLGVERLDDRLVPATWSVPWDNPQNLTVSFAPDGTDVGGSPNVLAKDLKADGFASASEWQGVILKALNTWSAAANVKFRQTWDWGSPFGTLGAAQGDLRFGDIRIASRPLSDDVAALGTPFTWSGSTWSGDIVLNSNVKFSSTGTAGTYDLFSVVLHETGHVLGLDGTADPKSVMDESYKLQSKLSDADVAAIQSLYGPPVATTTTTTNPFGQFFAKLFGTANGSFIGNLVGSLADKHEKDDFVVTAPAAVGTAPMNLIVYVRASDTTLGLTPQLGVYDAAGKPVPFEVISNTQGWVSVQVRDVKPGADYHLNVFNGTIGTKSLDYRIGMNFNQDPPIQRDLVSANALSKGKTAVAESFELNGSRLVSFSLSSTWNGDTAVRMTVTNAAGREVVKLVSSPNALPPTADVFLDAGAYTVKYEAFRPGGGTPKSVNYVARLEILNDPIGTYAPSENETTMKTMATPTPPPPTSPPPAAPPAAMYPVYSPVVTTEDYTYYGAVDQTLNTLYLYYYY